jgi:hypothetical protein
MNELSLEVFTTEGTGHRSVSGRGFDGKNVAGFSLNGCSIADFEQAYHQGWEDCSIAHKDSFIVDQTSYDDLKQALVSQFTSSHDDLVLDCLRFLERCVQLATSSVESSHLNDAVNADIRGKTDCIYAYFTQAKGDGIANKDTLEGSHSHDGSNSQQVLFVSNFKSAINLFDVHLEGYAVLTEVIKDKSNAE